MRIITRNEWGAKHGRGNDVSAKLPWGEVVIHTEAGAQRSPASETVEKGWIRNIEGFHAGPSRGWDGIAYSFLIAPSGRIFEGRGWGRSGAHTEGRNSTAAGVCFLGHGDKWPATEAQWAAARWLIGEGVALGKLKPSPAIGTHAKYSTKGKTCPGTLIAPHVVARLGGITGHGAPDAPGGFPHRVIRKGAKGPDVIAIKYGLNLLRKYTGRGQLPVTDVYDDLTASVVGSFQKFARDMQVLAGVKDEAELIDVDQVWGPQTGNAANFWGAP